ncbi:uncharacterized protein MKK02DRAFT_31730 [Dioszegia hungarica]|uniref:J domain-containing protein n=1 Tax=Dioszegia hungarica TaxID=4972 RepID=A0AA38LX99_9TREE|nr:uncharacterized protein MKK02DRAFT_31730 [Dioszegia hungarica]KAI9638263.1 hypothetical protein MKK02DRAFT_31730 [Dioszegia hungarica]
MSDTEDLQTYYTLLDIEESATPGEVRKAYLKKAAECHPDKHPEDEGATERFQALGEAYECLKDPHARREYDTKLEHLRRSSSRRSNSPPLPYSHTDHFGGAHGPPPMYAQYPRQPHPSHRPHTFFRATGFSTFPFPPMFRPDGPHLLNPLSMLSEMMASLPMHGLPRPGGAFSDFPFGPNMKRHRHPQPIPNFDPFGMFDQPFLPHHLGHGMAPSAPAFRGCPHPHPQMHPRHRPQHPHPYPFPPVSGRPARPIAGGAMLPHMGGPVPITRPLGPQGAPRRHQATYEIKDPTGRTTGFVHHSSMSWSA